MIKVAIDLHGTYDDLPHVFEKEIFTIPDVEFYIMSGSPVADIRDYLSKRLEAAETPEVRQAIAKLRILSIVDYCFEQKLPMEERVSERSGRKSWYFAGDEEVWWAMKSILCQKHDIRVLIDDKPQYLQYIGIGAAINFKHYMSRIMDELPRRKEAFEDFKVAIKAAKDHRVLSSVYYFN